jgi:hypothetical protein
MDAWVDEASRKRQDIENKHVLSNGDREQRAKI